MTSDMVALPGAHGTQPLPSTVGTAEARAERIRLGIVQFAQLLRDIADAFHQRDWAVLGYKTWDAYVAGEFGEARLHLDPSRRRQAVADLREAGLSIRAVAAALGVATGTVELDMKRVHQVSQDRDTSAEVTGVDGKRYAATRPAEAAEPAVVDEGQAVDDAPEGVAFCGQCRAQLSVNAVQAGATACESCEPDAPRAPIRYEPKPCEKCSADLAADEVEAGYTRCGDCDPQGDHVAADDGTCKGCLKTDPAVRAAAVAELASEYVRPAGQDDVDHPNPVSSPGSVGQAGLDDRSEGSPTQLATGGPTSSAQAGSDGSPDGSPGHPPVPVSLPSAAASLPPARREAAAAAAPTTTAADERTPDLPAGVVVHAYPREISIVAAALHRRRHGAQTADAAACAECLSDARVAVRDLADAGCLVAAGP